MFNEDKLKDIIRQNIKILDTNKIEFNDDLSFEQDLGLGSIEMVEIVVEIEEQFGFEFDYYILSDVIMSYGALKKYVEENYMEF